MADQGRAGDVVIAEDVLLAVEHGLAMGDFASHRSPTKTARYVIECLRALPVEQRMEAMGMKSVERHPDDHADHRTWWVDRG